MHRFRRRNPQQSTSFGALSLFHGVVCYFCKEFSQNRPVPVCYFSDERRNPDTKSLLTPRIVKVRYRCDPRKRTSAVAALRIIFSTQQCQISSQCNLKAGLKLQAQGYHHAVFRKYHVAAKSVMGIQRSKDCFLESYGNSELILLVILFFLGTSPDWSGASHQIRTSGTQKLWRWAVMAAVFEYTFSVSVLDIRPTWPNSAGFRITLCKF